MTDVLRPLGGHAVFLLLAQLAALLVVARLGAELAKRIGLAAIVGELAAGLVLGPSVFGHYFPAQFALLFPPVAEQFHLLEVVGTLGLVLLLLLTGLETDLRLLRNLGRAALIASTMGMLVPFAMGFGLGAAMPAEYIAQGEAGRWLFSAFLATALSISAMPVIAKILMDLDLTRRNIGLVILSAGVVDDTTGWLILSVIAGVASKGSVDTTALLRTLAYTALFIAGAAVILYPLARVVISAARTRFKTPATDLVMVVAISLVCAALTERIGVHAAFGAFVAGTVLRQVPRLDPDAVHRLEAFVFSILAPVFFGIVGLRVDLWSLGSGGGGMLGIVLAVACLGKLLGSTLGGLWGGMRLAEASAIAIAMNARGAMGLIAATIGLSLGILNEQMFSIIVVVAIVTSFMAPLGLRLVMRWIRPTQEEARRLVAEQSKGVFDPARVRILVPTAGGPNALGAARLAFGVARRSESAVTVLYVDAQSTPWERFLRRLRRDLSGRGIEQHLATLRGMADGGKPPEVRKAASRDVADAIVGEAGHGYDLVMMGASPQGGAIGGPVLVDVVERTPCHVAIVKAAGVGEAFKRIIVPIDGSAVSRVAAEFAVRYAEVSGATLTLGVLTEHRPQVAAFADESSAIAEETPRISEAELERISRVFKVADVKPEVRYLDYDPSRSALADAVEEGAYDLVVLGAENRAVQHRLFFGYENERLIRHSPVGVVVVVPQLERLKK